MSTLNRRVVLKTMAAGLATGVALQHLTTVDAQAADRAERVDEVYKGRRVVATADPLQVFIDGVELHVMTNADGRYSSIVNHYQSFLSLRDVARAAVDELAGAALVSRHGHH
jgi:hypothetical protein